MALGCRDEWAWGANASSIWHCQHICLSQILPGALWGKRDEILDRGTYFPSPLSSSGLFTALPRFLYSYIPIHNYLGVLVLIINFDWDIPNHGLFFCSKHRTRGELGKSNNELQRQLGSSRYRKADFPRSQLALPQTEYQIRTDTCPLLDPPLFTTYDVTRVIIFFLCAIFALDLRLDQADRQSSAAANGFLGFSSRFYRLDYSIWEKKSKKK